MKPIIIYILAAMLVCNVCVAQGWYHSSSEPKHKRWVHWLWPFETRYTSMKGYQMRYFIRHSKELNIQVSIDPPCLNEPLKPSTGYQDPPRVPTYGCLNYHHQPTPDSIEQQVVKDPLQALLNMAPSCFVNKDTLLALSRALSFCCIQARQIIPHNADSDTYMPRTVTTSNAYVYGEGELAILHEHRLMELSQSQQKLNYTMAKETKKEQKVEMAPPPPKQFMFGNGWELVDSISGFTGCVVYIVANITGCNQYGLQAECGTKTDTKPEIQMFDENRLIPTGRKMDLPKVEVKENGGLSKPIHKASSYVAPGLKS